MSLITLILMRGGKDLVGLQTAVSPCPNAAEKILANSHPEYRDLKIKTRSFDKRDIERRKGRQTWSGMIYM